jgi:hypothetical protein
MFRWYDRGAQLGGFPAHAGTIDHIEPHAHGGVDDAMENLATACWACNLQKSEFSLERLGWELRRPTALGWDGLVGVFGSETLITIPMQQAYGEEVPELTPDVQQERLFRQSLFLPDVDVVRRLNDGV